MNIKREGERFFFILNINNLSLSQAIILSSEMAPTKPRAYFHLFTISPIFLNSMDDSNDRSLEKSWLRTTLLLRTILKINWLLSPVTLH